MLVLPDLFEVILEKILRNHLSGNIPSSEAFQNLLHRHGSCDQKRQFTSQEGFEGQ